MCQRRRSRSQGGAIENTAPLHSSDLSHLSIHSTPGSAAGVELQLLPQQPTDSIEPDLQPQPPTGSTTSADNLVMLEAITENVRLTTTLKDQEATVTQLQNIIQEQI